MEHSNRFNKFQSISRAITITLQVILGAALLVDFYTSKAVAGPWYVSPTGNDLNDCLAPLTPRVSVNGVLGKATFTPGDLILLASGLYHGSGGEVILLDQSAVLSGGWNDAFTQQTGFTVIDGEDARRGITIHYGKS